MSADIPVSAMGPFPDAFAHRRGAIETVELHGYIDVWVITPDGDIRDHQHGHNVICTTGYTALTQALVWSGIQDQAANIGVTSPTYLTPLWGAVGNGSPVTPVKTDTRLVAELGRVTVGTGGSSPASTLLPAATVWQFFFPQPSVAWTVTEAGVFANASSVTNSGAMIDHLALSPSVSVPTTDTLILQVSLQLGP